MTAAPLVRLEKTHQGRVARLVLAAPPDNALTLDLYAVLQGLLDDLRADKAVRVVTLEGEGNHFSTGFPLAQRRPPAIGTLLERHHVAARSLASLTVPVVAKLRGLAIGAGLELALLAHVVLADPTARLGFPEVSLGAFPPLGTLLLPHRVGQTRAEQLLLSGTPIDGKSAEAMGLVTQCPGGWESLDEAAAKLVEQQILPGSRTAQAALVATLRPWLEHALGPALDERERLFLETVAESRDASEGISAALRSRPPRFVD